MTRYETTVLLCRKSDRQLIQVHVNLPRGAVIDKFLRAKLGMGNGILSLGLWNANLDEYLVIGIVNEKMWQEDRVIRRTIKRKRPSSAGH